MEYILLKKSDLKVFRFCLGGCLMEVRLGECSVAINSAL